MQIERANIEEKERVPNYYKGRKSNPQKIVQSNLGGKILMRKSLSERVDREDDF